MAGSQLSINQQSTRSSRRRWSSSRQHAACPITRRRGGAGHTPCAGPVASLYCPRPPARTTSSQRAESIPLATTLAADGATATLSLSRSGRPRKSWKTSHRLFGLDVLSLLAFLPSSFVPRVAIIAVIVPLQTTRVAQHADIGTVTWYCSCCCCCRCCCRRRC